MAELSLGSPAKVGWVSVFSINNGLSVWCGAMFGAQILFAFYLLCIYLLPTLLGATEILQQSGSIKGYREGDAAGNFIFLSHVIPAALLSVSGTLQLIPSIRNNHLQFHRWNGRFFLTVGVLGAVTGLYLTWVRGARLSDIGAIGITLNGLLIPLFVALAWRFALLKQWNSHQRFAVHAYILINGVLSFRLFLMSWYFLNQGANGNNSTLDGPADIALSFACYCVPMAVYELCRWAQSAGGFVRSVATVTVWVMACGTFIGLLTAGAFMWAPKLVAIYS
ncbi:DUF2306 domain-containing protein [Teredinibacter turnerae]|uniref:DUF2306 domain-containing protein n=1 Tax=Teredinibacter turnerae TaxID=2426 RepID=UPI00037D9AFF|nr:DUF2306 domain-containing protein [Teredinibacter turnerae]